MSIFFNLDDLLDDDFTETLNELRWQALGEEPMGTELRVEKLDIGRMTLEEFLIRAGVVREEASVVVPTILDQLLIRPGLVVPEEATGVGQGPEVMFGRSEKGRMIIHNKKPAAMSSRELNQEDDRTKQNVGAASSSGIGFSENIVLQPDSSSQQLMTEADDINIENVVWKESDDTNVSKKQSKSWTLDREYGINRDVLEQHSREKLGDAAEILGVSRSTLKRICRKHHIFRWPPREAKKSKCNLTEQAFFQTTPDNGNESTKRNKSLGEKDSVSNAAQSRTNAAEILDNSTIMVKATYKDDIIKFQLSISSRKLELEEEVATRLRLPVGSFKMKYLDEDDDWVLITCDTDLRTCLSTSQKQGKTRIKILVG